MWKWFVLCVSVLFWQDVSGDVRDQMVDVLLWCCNDGSDFARTHADLDCSSSQPVHDDVSSTFSSLCIIAWAKCCTDFRDGLANPTSSDTKPSSSPTPVDITFPEPSSSTTSSTSAPQVVIEPTTSTKPEKAIYSPNESVHKPEEPQQPEIQETSTEKPEIRTEPDRTSSEDEGEKHRDGSVVADTNQDSNKGTNVKSITCPSGFENHYGGCFDIDECATNRHTCYSTIESCRNTIGGYICDCAPGFRRDQVIGHCIKYTFPFTSPLPPVFHPELSPSIKPVIPTELLTTTDEPSTSTTAKSTTPKILGHPDDKDSALECPGGYTLDHDHNSCVDVDECATGVAECGPIQICTNLLGGYICDCPPGHSLIGDQECKDIDECEMAGKQSICSHNADCVNTIGSYQCRCRDGFRSVPDNDKVTGACEVSSSVLSSTLLPRVFQPELSPSIEPVIPTEPPTTTDAPPPAIGSSTSVLSTTAKPTTPRSRSFWGYRDDQLAATRPDYQRSSCDPGYHQNPKTGSCEDINECINGQSNCDSVEVCVNTQGGYRCECPPDWRLDQVRLRCKPALNHGLFPPGFQNESVYPSQVDQEFAREKPPPEITYTNDRGSVLKCPGGYRLGDNKCVDVDECDTGAAKCGPVQICTNLEGGYICSCPTGYKLIGAQECEDIDECEMADYNSICSRNADCVNTIGSYQCKCHDGFRSAPVNDKVCVDVDECLEARAGSLCQHRCNNVWGSYKCSCHRGYILTSDNRTCMDINECVQFKSKTPCVGTCLNEPGSYRCSCPPGYRLSEDRRSCFDIDECETGEAVCQTGRVGNTSHVCFNIRGDYRCQRITCPSGYQLESKYRCTKSHRGCSPGDWTCTRQPTTISHNFITFVSNLFLPGSNVKLFTMRGPAWPNTKIKFELSHLDTNAPPSVENKADINAFKVEQNKNEAVLSLVTPLEGPQSIELELSMELYNSREQFGGIAIAKLFIYVSEFEF